MAHLYPVDYTRRYFAADGGTPQPLPQVVSDPGDELPKLPPGPIPTPKPLPRVEDLPQVVSTPPVPVPTTPAEQ